MKQNDDYYEKWLNAVKRTEPALDNPNELTDRIMQRVSEEVSFRKGKKKYLLFSWVSGIVAVALLCLFINEAYFTPFVSVGHYDVTSLPLHDNTFPQSADWNRMSLVQKSNYLHSKYAATEEKNLSKMLKNRINLNQ